MTSSADLGSTIVVAAASSVARAFVIGAVGYVAVRCGSNPIIPPKFVGAFARTNYLLLLCPLYYSAIGKGVTPSMLAKLWTVVVGYFIMVLVGEVVSQALTTLKCFRFLWRNHSSLRALRVLASLPNSVMLPLLILPGLCEYDIVHEAFSDPDSSSPEEMMQECTNNANVMISLCGFAFCVCLFCRGRRALLESSSSTIPSSHASPHEITFANKDENLEVTECTLDSSDDEMGIPPRVHSESLEIEPPTLSFSQPSQIRITEDKDDENSSSFWETSVGSWIKNVFGNAGSIAMLLGLLTGCIPWLPSALFVPGGSLRFLGGALDVMGQAATPVSLLVVGASLYDPEEEDRQNGPEEDNAEAVGDGYENEEKSSKKILAIGSNEDADGVSGDKNGPVQEAEKEFRTTWGWSQEEILTHVWLDLSRLILAPAVVCSLLISLDCGVPGAFGNDEGKYQQIPHLFKLVMLIVSASPSAMSIIVIVKAAAAGCKTSSNNKNNMARSMAKLYLPVYVLSTITVAFWSIVGLWISLPNEDGLYFCEK